MFSIRLATAVLAVAVLIAPLGAAPRAQYDYYLTGDAADVAGATEYALGLMGGGTDVGALFTWMSDLSSGLARALLKWPAMQRRVAAVLA